MTKEFYHQKRPHFLPRGRTFFITTRLYDSIPKCELENLNSNFEQSYKVLKNDVNISPIVKENLIHDLRTRHFIEFENLLEKINNGPHYLKEPEVAKIVMEQLHKSDGLLYDLRCYCIMSNHIHIVLRTIEEDKYEEQKTLFYSYPNVDFIMKKIKGASARYANIFLERTGQSFWEKESFDMLIRNEKMYWKVIQYVLNNPVKVGLVKNKEDYPFSYLKDIDVDYG